VERVKTAPHAGAMSPFTNLDSLELARLTEFVGDAHLEFAAQVRRWRKLDSAAFDRVDGGKVFSGSRSVALGLADADGGVDDAVRWVRQRAGLSRNAEVRWTQPAATGFRAAARQGLHDRVQDGPIRGIPSTGCRKSCPFPESVSGRRLLGIRAGNDPLPIHGAGSPGPDRVLLLAAALPVRVPLAQHALQRPQGVGTGRDLARPAVPEESAGHRADLLGREGPLPSRHRQGIQGPRDSGPRTVPGIRRPSS
jgi:hypothetical protein